MVLSGTRIRALGSRLAVIGHASGYLTCTGAGRKGLEHILRVAHATSSRGTGDLTAGQDERQASARLVQFPLVNAQEEPVGGRVVFYRRSEYLLREYEDGRQHA